MATTELSRTDRGDYVEVVEFDDVARTKTVRAEWKAGTFVAVSQALVVKANAARAANIAFLANGSPSQAQAAAQVQALTRQVNALISLQLQQADSSGT